MNRRSTRHQGLKALVGAALGLMVCVNFAHSTDLPTYQQVKKDWRSPDAWLLDRNGRELQRVRLDNTARRYEWTSVNQISPALKDALLASEDQRFYDHGGVDWAGAVGEIGRAHV